MPVVPHVSGSVVVYRLFDVGYAIELEQALDRLATSAPERVRPIRGEAQALQIPNPPVSVILGTERLALPGHALDAEVSARIFDFGVVSVRARVDAAPRLAWPDFVRFGTVAVAAPACRGLLEQHARSLVDRMGAAIERPLIAPVREDYGVFRIRELTDGAGGPLPVDVVRDVDLVPLLLSETRPLSREARRELLPHRFSYYADDLAVVTWENALVVDPAVSGSDVEFIIEFANAQLLELRYYDALLDGEIPKLYDRIERARGGGRGVFRRRYAGLLADMQTLVADSTELVERVENAMKVTDDVYLARIYGAALELFRGRVWRSGIDRKLTIIRETYAMLNAEAQAARAETLELAIVLLIVAEIVLSLLH